MCTWKPLGKFELKISVVKNRPGKKEALWNSFIFMIASTKGIWGMHVSEWLQREAEKEKKGVNNLITI